MPRYRMPAWVYVDAEDLGDARLIFQDMCNLPYLGLELDRETGTVVYIDEKFDDEVEGGYYDRKYCVDGCEEE